MITQIVDFVGNAWRGFGRWNRRRSGWVELVTTRFRSRRRTDTYNAPAEDRRQQRNRKRDASAFRNLFDEIFLDFERCSRRTARHLRKFPPIDPIPSRQFRTRLGEIQCFENLAWLDFDATPLERVPADLQGCILGCVVDDDDETKVIENRWWVCRLRRVGLRALRGRCRIVPPWCVDSQMVSNASGRVLAWSNTYVSLDGVEWRLLERDGTFGSADDAGKIMRLRMSSQITERYAWKIVVRDPRRFSLALPLDAVGVRELLMLRDVDLGSRRSPIRHLVKEHKRRLAGGKTTWVRAHLRGTLECSWRGWRIEIIPSEHDRQHLDASRSLPQTDLLALLGREAERLDGMRKRSSV